MASVGTLCPIGLRRRLTWALGFMRKLVALTLVLAVGGTSAQTLEPEAQLPDWSLPQWHTIAKRKGLTISTRINPFVWRGDFDGDKRVDLALIVKNSQTGKEGLVFLLRSNRSVVLGAGSPFGGDPRHVAGRSVR